MANPLFPLLRAAWRAARRFLPRRVRRRVESSVAASGLRSALGQSKAAAELAFWRDQARRAGGNLRRDDYYEHLVRRMADLPDDFSFAGLVVIDIGCGPRGSLCWITGARLCIGVDPLADAYRELGIADQPMSYVGAAAERLPLKDASIDVVITINALDHVDDIHAAFREIRRVLRPGGLFMGSINLREVPTATEPSVVSRTCVERELLAGWRVEYLLVFPECDVPDDAYRYASQAPPPDYRAEMDVLWCRARVSSDAVARR